MREKRIPKAADSLRETKDKTIDVGLSCGFQDIGDVIKSFKQMYEMTPNEFQKKGLGPKIDVRKEIIFQIIRRTRYEETSC